MVSLLRLETLCSIFEISEVLIKAMDCACSGSGETGDAGPEIGSKFGIRDSIFDIRSLNIGLGM
jgi:hypothetical protein